MELWNHRPKIRFHRWEENEADDVQKPSKDL